jgi:hypothetical protein
VCTRIIAGALSLSVVVGCGDLVVDLRGGSTDADTGVAPDTGVEPILVVPHPWSVDGDAPGQRVGAGGVMVLDMGRGISGLLVTAPDAEDGVGAVALHLPPEIQQALPFSLGRAVLHADESDRLGAAVVLLHDPVLGPVVAMGAPSADGSSGVTAGAVVVVPQSALQGEVWTSQAETSRIRGRSWLGNFGATLAQADVDGDGRPDLIVGAPQDSVEAGRVYLFTTDDVAQGVDSHDASGQLGGMEPWDRLGASLAAGGDIDGDGIDDVVVGAPGFDVDGARSGEGAAAVISGAAWFGAGDADALDLAMAVVTGDSHNDRLADGADSMAIGDVDRDGRADLLVGAPGSDLQTTDGGAAGLFHAPELAGILALSQANLVLTGTGEAGTGVGVLQQSDGSSLLFVGAPSSGDGGSAGLVPSELSGRRPLADASSHRVDGEVDGEAVGSRRGALATLRDGEEQSLMVPIPAGARELEDAGHVVVRPLTAVQIVR